MGVALHVDALGPRSTGASSVSTEARIHAGVLACLCRFGLSKTTLDDIARESGVSRATIYRTYPGGRDRIFEAVLVEEIDRYFAGLAVAIDGADDLEDLLVAGIGAAMRGLLGHEALRALIALEPGLVLPQFAFHRLDRVLALAADFAAPRLAPHLDDPTEARSLAEHLARIVLSYTLHPSSRIDAADPSSIRDLVRNHVLPGIARVSHPS